MCDFVLGVETSHLLAGKVCPIVKDNSMREPEVAHYVLPEDLDNLLPDNFREWHCLPPPGTELRLCTWEWFVYVQPPLHEGQGLRKV